jgi:hypothetical protein
VALSDVAVLTTEVTTTCQQGLFAILQGNAYPLSEVWVVFAAACGQQQQKQQQSSTGPCNTFVLLLELCNPSGVCKITYILSICTSNVSRFDWQV